MPFAALDLHRKEVEAVLLDDAGVILCRDRFPATREAIIDFARRRLSLQHRIAIEATTSTWAVADLLRPHCAAVVISNPLRTRAIAEARIKTDKIDALVLAQLLRLDYLPSVWAPDEPTQALRRDTTERACLVSDRTRIKNRIHAILHQRLIPAPPGDLFSEKNLAWLAALDIDEAGRQALRRQFQLLAFTEELIGEVTDGLAAQAYADPRIKLLMTLPGVDFTVAQTVLSAFGDSARFPTPAAPRLISAWFLLLTSRASIAITDGSRNRDGRMRAGCWSKPRSTSIGIPGRSACSSAASRGRKTVMWRWWPARESWSRSPGTCCVTTSRTATPCLRLWKRSSRACASASAGGAAKAD